MVNKYGVGIKLVSICLGIVMLLGLTLSAAEALKVGLLAPLTGSDAANARDFLNGATLAIEEINSSGGVLGHMLALVPYDTGERETDKVVLGFDRLVYKDKVDVILTGTCSSTNFEIELAAEYEMPYLLSGSATQTEKIIAPNPEAYPTVWSNCGSYAVFRTGYADVTEWIIEQTGLVPPNRKVAIINSDNDYSRNIGEGIRDRFGELGWTVPIYEMVPYGAVLEWGSLLTKLRGEEPAVILLTDYILHNGVSFLRQFQENPINAFVMTEYVGQMPEFPDLMGEKKEGVVWQMMGGILKTPEYPQVFDWIKRFELRFGYEPGKYGATLYDAVYIWKKAVEEVGDAKDHLAIGNALAETDYWGNCGHIVFEPTTHLALVGSEYQPWLFYQWQGETREIVYPSQWATSTFVPQPWMEWGE